MWSADGSDSETAQPDSETDEQRDTNENGQQSGLTPSDGGHESGVTPEDDDDDESGITPQDTPDNEQ